MIARQRSDRPPSSKAAPTKRAAGSTPLWARGTRTADAFESPTLTKITAQSIQREPRSLETLPFPDLFTSARRSSDNPNRPPRISIAWGIMFREIDSNLWKDEEDPSFRVRRGPAPMDAGALEKTDPPH